jgi:hypothetical protein
VDGQFVGKIFAGAGGLDRVNVADHIGNGHVGSGQLFYITLFAGQPGDGSGVTFGSDAVAAGAAQRGVGIVVNFAAGDIGNAVVHEFDEAAQDSRLGLTTETQKNKMMTGQDGVDDLGQHGVFVTVHAMK